MSRLRTLRVRLTVVAVLMTVVTVGGLTAGFNVLLAGTLKRDIDSRLRSQAGAAATTVDTAGGRLRVQESPDDDAIDRQVWIFDRHRALVRPSAGSTLQRAADALAGRSGVVQEHAGARLYAAAITGDGRRLGTVVTAQSLAAYDRTTDVALLASLILAGVVVGGMLALTWGIVGRALRPVRDMTRKAAEWSERDPARRFGASAADDELGELAQTFDALLNRVAASLRHEQQLSSELSHELRTPLARILAEAELLQRRERDPEVRQEAYRSIAASAEQMNAILETLMAAARADARLEHGRSDVGEALSRLRATWEPAFARRQIDLDVIAPTAPVMVGVDREVVERIVTPVLDNAQRYARSRVTVAAAGVDGRLVVTVTDDGPGLPMQAHELVFQPGWQLAADEGHTGAGLGLSLARRLARAVSGDVVAGAPVNGGGAEFRIELPA